MKDEESSQEDQGGPSSASASQRMGGQTWQEDGQGQAATARKEESLKLWKGVDFQQGPPLTSTIAA